MAKLSASTEKKQKNRFMTLSWRNTWQLSLLTVPGIVWFIIFCYIPMFGCIIAFKDFNFKLGIWGSEWCGLENFQYLFASSDAVRILRNTICYNLMFITLGIVLGVTFALFLEQITKKYLIKTFQTMMFLPYFVSWVVAAFIAQGLFKYEGGVLNNLREIFGKDPLQWYTTIKPWPFILILANIWKTIGFNVLMYYGALLGIDKSLYEAATIDGANTRQRIFEITLPLLKPTIIVLFIMGVGNIMRADFGLFFYVPNNYGSLYEVTDVIDTYIYRALKQAGDIPGSSASSFFQSVCGLVTVVVANGIVRKIDPENAMF